VVAPRPVKIPLCKAASGSSSGKKKIAESESSDEDIKRTLARHNSDEAAQRAMDGHVDYVTDKSLLTNKRLANGQNSIDFVKARMKKNKSLPNKKRLTPAFWSELEDAFQFGGPKPELQEPSDDEEPDEKLFAHILAVHSENPTVKKTQPLERYLEHCEPINRSNMYGLLQLINTCPSLSVFYSSKCQIAVLGYWART